MYSHKSKMEKIEIFQSKNASLVLATRATEWWFLKWLPLRLLWRLCLIRMAASDRWLRRRFGDVKVWQLQNMGLQKEIAAHVNQKICWHFRNLNHKPENFIRYKAKNHNKTMLSARAQIPLCQILKKHVLQTRFKKIKPRTNRATNPLDSCPKVSWHWAFKLFL
jgi:hypothetical protein